MTLTAEHLKQLTDKHQQLTQQLTTLDQKLRELESNKKNTRVISMTRLKRIKLAESLQKITMQRDAALQAQQEAARYKTRDAKIARLLELAQEEATLREHYIACLNRANDVLSVHKDQNLTLEANRVLNAQMDELKSAYARMKQKQKDFLELSYHLAPGLLALQQVATYANPEHARALLRELDDLRVAFTKHGKDLQKLINEYQGEYW